ncbi:MAG: bifunctional DNA-formamidopyrimidine glycosylase/DNA-(apurinic or apyrimidinic site) lyase [Candidatus Edwardsbacteria bacterium]|nr:bifunctional DNA-formamidopyrimidine glycosylase/DNA-(apurinic or apyrimidinic site) lyase [Candidatus Edwardsbacteria bacterium]
MPELPEVETIRRDLDQEIRNRVITRVEVLNGGSVTGTSGRRFAAALRGRRFAGFGRRGKYLFFLLDSGKALVSHLKMTGVLLHQAPHDPLPRTARIIFYFLSGDRLVFADLRKFGFMQLSGDPYALPAIRKLGPEPLDRDFVPARLSEILMRRTGPIKAVLLDQTAVAGLGNIYALEALHRAGVSPKRKACSLKNAEIVKLHRAIVNVLKEAIAARGSSVDSYRDGRGRRGWFQVKHRVYGREGEKCFKCGTMIVKEQFRGRGTYWCSKCQH